MSDRIKHIEAFIAEAEGKAAINEEARTIRFVISSAAIDRDNESVLPSAIAGAIKEFAKNPVCLACHQHKLDSGMPPVVGSWDTDSFKATEKRCEMDLVFAATDLAETYWQLYKSKHMRAVSIGFRVQDGREVVVSGKRHFEITKIELYEISCVAVGANRDALSKLKSLGWQADDGGDRLKELAAQLKTDITRLREEVLDQLDEIKCLLIPGSDEDASLPGDASNPSDAAKQADAGDILDEIANLLKKFGE